jgi:hypothetical protein
MKYVRLEGVEVTDTPLDFATDVNGLEIELTQRLTTVPGGVSSDRGARRHRRRVCRRSWEVGATLAFHRERASRSARPIHDPGPTARPLSGDCRGIPGAWRGTGSGSARGMASRRDDLHAVGGRDARSRSEALHVLTPYSSSAKGEFALTVDAARRSRSSSTASKTAPRLTGRRSSRVDRRTPRRQFVLVSVERSRHPSRSAGVRATLNKVNWERVPQWPACCDLQRPGGDDRQA